MSTKSAIIIGRANSVWDDLEEASMLFGTLGSPDLDAAVIVINGVGVDYRHRIDHWVSFHAELLPYWMEARQAKGFSDGYQLWTCANGRRMGAWELALGLKLIDLPQGGSSGMIALLVALELGADKIVLAGVPMDNSYGHYDGSTWDEADMHWKAWEKLSEEVKGKVRSLSGRTRRFFGYPTTDWLRSN